MPHGRSRGRVLHLGTGSQSRARARPLAGGSEARARPGDLMRTLGSALDGAWTVARWHRSHVQHRPRKRDAERRVTWRPHAADEQVPELRGTPGSIEETPDPVRRRQRLRRDRSHGGLPRLRVGVSREHFAATRRNGDRTRSTVPSPVRRSAICARRWGSVPSSWPTSWA